MGPLDQPPAYQNTGQYAPPQGYAPQQPYAQPPQQTCPPQQPYGQQPQQQYPPQQYPPQPYSEPMQPPMNNPVPSQPMVPRDSGPLGMLMANDFLFVQQEKSCVEMLTGCIEDQTFEVMTRDGSHALFIAEEDSNMASKLCCANFRPYTMSLRSTQGQTVCSFERPYRFHAPECCCNLQELTCRDASGKAIGRLQQEFELCERLFTVYDANDRAVCTINGPIWRPWTFSIKVNGRKAGQIRKRWGGIRELIGDEDCFTLSYPDMREFPSITPEIRAVLLGALFLIDYIYFERRQQNSGSDDNY